MAILATTIVTVSSGKSMNAARLSSTSPWLLLFMCLKLAGRVLHLFFGGLVFSWAIFWSGEGGEGRKEGRKEVLAILSDCLCAQIWLRFKPSLFQYFRMLESVFLQVLQLKMMRTGVTPVFIFYDYFACCGGCDC